MTAMIAFFRAKKKLSYTLGAIFMFGAQRVAHSKLNYTDTLSKRL